MAAYSWSWSDALEKLVVAVEPATGISTVPLVGTVATLGKVCSLEEQC